jgi:hypothetical protein
VEKPKPSREKPKPSREKPKDTRPRDKFGRLLNGFSKENIDNNKNVMHHSEYKKS